MYDTYLNTETVTGRIRVCAVKLLEAHPEGIRWTDLNRMIQAADEAFHPKTINGTVWKLVETLPDLVYKPKKGLFMHTKYRAGNGENLG